MKKLGIFFIPAIVASVSLASTVFAQEPSPGPPGDFAGGAAAMKRFRVMRVAEIQEILKLDDGTTIKLNGILIKYDQEREKTMKEIHNDMKLLKDAMDKDAPDEKKVAQILDKLSGDRERTAKIMCDEMKEMKQLLTPTQQAKLVLQMERIGKPVRGPTDKSCMKKGLETGMEQGPSGHGMGPGMGPCMGPGGLGGDRLPMPPPPPDGF